MYNGVIQRLKDDVLHKMTICSSEDALNMIQFSKKGVPHNIAMMRPSCISRDNQLDNMHKDVSAHYVSLCWEPSSSMSPVSSMKSLTKSSINVRWRSVRNCIHRERYMFLSSVRKEHQLLMLSFGRSLHHVREPLYR